MTHNDLQMFYFKYETSERIFYILRKYNNFPFQCHYHQRSFHLIIAFASMINQREILRNFNKPWKKIH